jgi:TPR repeat protein
VLIVGEEEGGGVSLKACKSCMRVKYCNAKCQRNHWPKHKNYCKLRAAELHDEALFKDPPPKEDCAICFLPMPVNIISCMTLPPATILSVPIKDFAIAHDMFANMATEVYYECCGKSICVGCIHSFGTSGNMGKCPFCNSERMGKTDEERIKDLMKRVEANDAASIYLLADSYNNGLNGFHQDQEKAIELYARAAKLGSSKAQYNLGNEYRQGGNMKKAKIHYEAAAMAGHECARYNLGLMEIKSGNTERAVKHYTIASSAGNYHAMNSMLVAFNHGVVSRESIDSTLAAYNTSCAEMRSEARDAYIQIFQERE